MKTQRRKVVGKNSHYDVYHKMSPMSLQMVI